MKYIAHIREKDGEFQLLKNHLIETKLIAEKVGSKIGVKYLAGMAGLLHDLGKYSDDFQEYIREAVSNPDAPPKRGSVDHSTAGGRFLVEMLYQSSTEKLVAEVVGNAIISHHGGINDYISPINLETPYYRRVYEKELQGYNKAKKRFFEEVMTEEKFKEYAQEGEKEIQRFIHHSKQLNRDGQGFFKDIDLLTKYIFSCLVDADRTNSRLFEENTSEQIWNQEKFFYEASIKLNKQVDQFEIASPTPINQLRNKMSYQAFEFASKPSDIYQLSIPTGGGKTFASLRYALQHAKIYKKNRIVYVVPFTTIIEQNAQVVRKIVGYDYLLEHHSNVIDDDFLASEEMDSFENKNVNLKLAKDNWDTPVIFTTMVQYLNVFYSKGTRNIRRLHNLTNAIIIFDEVQAVPVKCLALFNESLNFLKNYGKSSLLLCTATQPALDYVTNDLKLSKDSEIIKDLPKVVEAFERVKIIPKLKTTGWHELDITNFSKKIMESANSLLIILNTKKAVRQVFKQLILEDIPDSNIFHLSTSMCPKHRQKQINEMINQMKNKQRVICVSSQLIEAGVDISFDHVIRSLAGLDSIAQAAGRCNRHGNKPISEVYIINVNNDLENTSKLPEIKRGASISHKLISSLINKTDKEDSDLNLLSPELMHRYFREYYAEFQTDFKYYVRDLEMNLFDLIGNNESLRNSLLQKNGFHYPLLLTSSMQTIGTYFNVIESKTIPVLVPFDEKGEEVIALLNGNPSVSNLSLLLKKSQSYQVNLYDQEVKQLNALGLLKPLYNENGYYLLNNAYDETYGVDFEGNSFAKTMFI